MASHIEARNEDRAQAMGLIAQDGSKVAGLGYHYVPMIGIYFDDEFGLLLRLWDLILDMIEGW